MVERKETESLDPAVEVPPVLAEIQEAVELEETFSEVENGVSVGEEAQVGDEIDVEDLRMEDVEEDREVDLPEEKEGEDQFDTFAPSSFATHTRPISPTPSVLLLRKSQPHTAATPSTLSRSFSLPGLYRLGLGTLGRSYSLTGIGPSEKGLEPPRVEGGVERLIEDWILHGDESAKAEGDVKYHIEVRKSSPIDCQR